MPHAPADHVAPQDRLAEHLPALRTMLEHQRRFRLEQLAELDAVVEDAATPADATDAARREVAIKVAAAARQALADIEVALALVTNGDYGRCRGCGTDIPMSLLRAVPTSQWCLHCRGVSLPHDSIGAISTDRRSAYQAFDSNSISRP